MTGLVVGAVAESASGVAGWDVIGAAAGFALGLFIFMLRSDT